MAQTTILATGQTAATSTDVVVADGSSVTVGLFVASGAIPPNAGARVMLDTPGADVVVAELSGLYPTTVLSGPGTFRVVRNNISAFGVNVGIFTEA